MLSGTADVAALVQGAPEMPDLKTASETLGDAQILQVAFEIAATRGARRACRRACTPPCPRWSPSSRGGSTRAPGVPSRCCRPASSAAAADVHGHS